jgi:hypothetical protein
MATVAERIAARRAELAAEEGGQELSVAERLAARRAELAAKEAPAPAPPKNFWAQMAARGRGEKPAAGAPVQVQAPAMQPPEAPPSIQDAFIGKGIDLATPPPTPGPPKTMGEEVSDYAGAASFGRYLQRVGVRNIGRVAGALAQPAYEIKGAMEGWQASSDAQRLNAEMRELRDDMVDPATGQPTALGTNPHAIALLERLEGQRNERRDNARAFQSKTLNTLKTIEDTIKQRVSASGTAALPSFYDNLVADSTDVGQGLYHLVVLDILGTDGESDAAAAMPDVDSFADLINYSGAVLGEGFNRGGDLSAGLAGAAMALSATMVPEAGHQLSNDLDLEILGVDLGGGQAEDQNEWRSDVGAGADAIMAMPVTSALFLYPTLKRGVLRYKGKMNTMSPAWKETRQFFEKKYGKNSPEFKNWLKGKGPVPKDLAKAEASAKRIRDWADDSLAVRNFPAGVDASIASIDKASAAWTATKRGASAAKDKALDAAGAERLRGAGASGLQWLRKTVSDALGQVDETSKMHGNQLLRQTAEVDVAPSSVGRKMTTKIEEGTVFEDPPAPPVPPVPANIPRQAQPPAWKRERPEPPKMRPELAEAAADTPPPLPDPSAARGAYRNRYIATERNPNVYRDGHKFEGVYRELSDGSVQHIQGKLISPDGSVFEGAWGPRRPGAPGTQLMYGTKTAPDGTVIGPKNFYRGPKDLDGKRPSRQPIDLSDSAAKPSGFGVDRPGPRTKMDLDLPPEATGGEAGLVASKLPPDASPKARPYRVGKKPGTRGTTREPALPESLTGPFIDVSGKQFRRPVSDVVGGEGPFRPAGPPAAVAAEAWRPWFPEGSKLDSALKLVEQTQKATPEFFAEKLGIALDDANLVFNSLKEIGAIETSGAGKPWAVGKPGSVLQEQPVPFELEAVGGPKDRSGSRMLGAIDRQRKRSEPKPLAEEVVLDEAPSEASVRARRQERSEFIDPASTGPNAPGYGKYGADPYMPAPPSRPKAKPDAEAAPKQTPAEEFINKGDEAPPRTQGPDPATLEVVEQAAPTLKRVHWHGIHKHEWPGPKGFIQFALDRFGKKPLELVKDPDSPFFENGDKLAQLWHRRDGQSRPFAMVKARTHNFSPEETSYWAAQVARHKGRGDSLKKAEYKAYADVLNARGIPATSDITSLGLKISQILEFAEDPKLKSIGTELMKDQLMDAGVPADKAARFAAEAYADATSPGATPMVPPQNNPVWRTQAKANAPKAEVFAELNRVLNEELNLADDGRQLDFGDLKTVVELAEEANGLKITSKRPPAQPKGPVDPTSPPVQRELMFSPEYKWSESLTRDFNETAKFIGVAPEVLMKPYAEIMNWNANTYFLKSKVAQRRLKDLFLNRYKAWAKENSIADPTFGRGRKTLDAWLEKNDIFKTLDRRIKNMAMGWGTKKMIMETPKGASNFVFDIAAEARRLMASDEAFSKKVLADAVQSVSITVGETLATARLKDFAAKELARAPATAAEGSNYILEAYTTGNASPPSYLKVPPEAVAKNIKSRIGRGALDGVAKNDLFAALRGLRRMEALPKNVKEFLGFGEDAVWASRPLIKAIELEMAQQRMIKGNSLYDKFLRTAKRGRVVLNFPTAIRNWLSDANLLYMQTGRLTAMRDAIRDGRLMHAYQTGKLKRPAKPEWIDTFEALENLERVRLVDSTLIEAEFGRSRHKGILSALTDADVLKGLPSERLLRLELALEKGLAAPLLKTFRAATNSMKVTKALESYKTVLKEMDMLDIGDTPAFEVFPNVYVKLEMVSGQKGFPGGRGYKNLSTGKLLTPAQFKQIVARVAKVTSDKLFFDYNDAGAFVKMLRTHDGLRWTLGSMYAMYYAKSMFVPGVQKGLMFEVMNPNPSYIPGNARVRDVHLTRTAESQMRVAAMQSGARARMLNLQDREHLMNELAWNASEQALGALASTETPDSVDFFDMSSADFNESSRDLSRLLKGAYVHTMLASGVLEDEHGELSVLWPLPTEKQYKGMSREQRKNYNLASIQDPAKRRWHKSMREMLLREKEGRGATKRDVFKVMLLNGGPALNMILDVMNDDAQSRVTDFKKMFTKSVYALAGGTVGGMANVTVAWIDPTSSASSFRYEIKNPDEWIKKPMSARAKSLVRWTMKQIAWSGWDEKDLSEDSKARKYRASQTKAALTLTFVKPFADQALAYESLEASATTPDSKKKFKELRKAAEAKADFHQDMVDERMDELEQRGENNLNDLKNMRKMKARYKSGGGKK